MQQLNSDSCCSEERRFDLASQVWWCRAPWCRVALITHSRVQSHDGVVVGSAAGGASCAAVDTAVGCTFPLAVSRESTVLTSPRWLGVDVVPGWLETRSQPV